jgi:hypothetical protein
MLHNSPGIAAEFVFIHFFACPKKRTKERAPRTRSSISIPLSNNLYHSDCARGDVNAAHLLKPVPLAGARLLTSATSMIIF